MPEKNAYLPVNPVIVAWARKRCALSLEEVAAKLHLDPERIANWENGDRQPTVRQARELARIYDFPFLEFFSKKIPPLPKPTSIPDFRSITERKSARAQFLLEEVQVWAEENRLNALDLLDLIGDEPPAFSKQLRAKLSDDYEAVAQYVRKILKFDVAEQFALKSSERIKLPSIIRAKFEAAGALVLRMGRLHELGVRGICIFNEVLPTIVFSSSESPGAQSFTLAHEFAHIILQQSGISGQPRLGGRTGKREIETWCNKFAAAFLMPKEVVIERAKDLPKNADHISNLVLNNLAAAFCVSRHAMMIRLVTLGFVKAQYYWRIKRPEFLKEEAEYEGFGKTKYYGQRYRSSRGDYYTGLVIEAWNLRRITNHNAAEFMGINNLSHMNDIRANFG